VPVKLSAFPAGARWDDRPTVTVPEALPSLWASEEEERGGSIGPGQPGHVRGHEATPRERLTWEAGSSPLVYCMTLIGPRLLVLIKRHYTAVMDPPRRPVSFSFAERCPRHGPDWEGMWAPPGHRRPRRRLGSHGPRTAGLHGTSSQPSQPPKREGARSARPAREAAARGAGNRETGKRYSCRRHMVAVVGPQRK